ncbi:MAG TPA: N-acetylglucosamine-6-phosphate deacetylase [Candidatus Merdenecus merdavium]|nr:N-acetylglucosamine-6-phosphate deacetylase [Candidatus Merdenecus merdavium]
MIIKNANVFREDCTFEHGNIYMKDHLIESPSQNPLDNDDTIDATGMYAIPGFTDLHFHGCVGYDFCDGTHEAIEKIAEYEAQHGITTIIPASMTFPEEKLAQIFESASTYLSEKGATLCGINMEGPYINCTKKGAQNGEYIHKPDVAMYQRLQKKSNDLIKLVAIAPEEDGSMDFIETLKDEVVLSVAHTTADYETTMEAFRRGASHVTHLFNAMPAFTHRAPGVVGAAFDFKKAYVELITDGIHITPTVIRATFQMFGDDRIILVSDSMMATGLEDGDYTLGGQTVKVVGHRATLADGTLAGSATNLMDCFKVAVKEMGIPLESGIKCAAVNPAKEMGIYHQYGSITPGKVANIVLLDKDLNIKYVILRGKVIVENK